MSFCDCIHHIRLGPRPEEYETQLTEERNKFIERCRLELERMTINMPHDSKGRLLAEGDEVVMRGKIVKIHQGEQYCNCDVDFLPMPPNTEPYRNSAINTRQLEKVGDVQPE